MKAAWYRWKFYVLREEYRDEETNAWCVRRLPLWLTWLRVAVTGPIMVTVTIFSIPIRGFFKFMEAVAR